MELHVTENVVECWWKQSKIFPIMKRYYEVLLCFIKISEVFN